MPHQFQHEYMPNTPVQYRYGTPVYTPYGCCVSIPKSHSPNALYNMHIYKVHTGIHDYMHKLSLHTNVTQCTTHIHRSLYTHTHTPPPPQMCFELAAQLQSFHIQSGFYPSPTNTFSMQHKQNLLYITTWSKAAS